MDNARAAERFFWLLSFATWQTLLNNFTIEGYFRKIADPRDIASTAGAWKHASPNKIRIRGTLSQWPSSSAVRPSAPWPETI